MSFCDGDPDADLEHAQFVEDWFNVSASSTTAIIVIITTFLLYWNCRFKEIPLFVTLQMLLLIIRIPISLSLNISKILNENQLEEYEKPW